MTDPVLIDLPTSIETERLLMRPPQAGDGAMLYAAITESLPELRRFLASLPWVAAEQSIESSEVYCRNAQANFLARKDLPFLMSRARNGFISEAVAALTTYAFANLRAVRVEIITDEENNASRRVAERCAFVLEGVLRNERRAPDGSLRNTCIYARLLA
jgi:hypothetical protein